MATSGELAEVLSASLGFKLGTVNYYGQELRDAGLLSTGGRGPSAVTMTHDDAANWLLAMCCAETAKSAAAIVKLTRDTPLYGTPTHKGDHEPSDELTFPKARSVKDLLTALMRDAKAGSLDDVLIMLDFYIGGGRVDFIASGFSGSTTGIDWRVSMEFVHTWDSRRAIPTRRRDTDERPITAKRATINRISRGALEDIASVLSDEL